MSCDIDLVYLVKGLPKLSKFLGSENLSKHGNKRKKHSRFVLSV